MKPKVKITILDYLKLGNWVSGGTIEAYCAGVCKVKNSNVGRRLRELEVAGSIEAEYRKLQGVSNKVVFYRLSFTNLIARKREEMYFRKPTNARLI